MDIRNAVKQWLTEKENKRYAKRLQEKRISYGQWVRAREEERDALVNDDCERIARMVEEGSATGSSDEYIIFLASDGVFLFGQNNNIGRYLKKHPYVKVLYGDEEVGEAGVDEPERKLPWFKPDWSPDVLKEYFYFGSAVAVRSSVLKEMEEKGMPFQGFAERKEASAFVRKWCPDWAEIPIYRVTDVSAYRKWMLACVEHVGGFRKGNRAIGHMPEVWFSCESQSEQNKFLDSDWGTDGTARQDAERVEKADAQVRYKSAGISVVIPSKDNPELLEKCIRACLEVTKVSEVGQVSSLEFIVVDNGSAPENQIKIETFVADFHMDGQKADDTAVQISYHYHPMEFNFSKMCNLGAAEAKGDFLLFLNDDVELCGKDTLEEMVALAAQEYTGAVGLKLLYPGTDTIQHAGITNLPMGPVHKLQFLQDGGNHYCNANRGKRNVMAVTAACLMVAVDKFREAGGFSEELKVAFNDVDFCFRLFELGYHNVCVNDRYAYHHESLSRGADESVEKLNRLIKERDKLYMRHPELRGFDPYYSEHLNREGLDTGIRPAYITFRNQTQDASEKLKKIELHKYRQDACLMVRVEDFSHGTAIGYGVVLGDNNACYEKALLLQNVSPEEVVGETYRVPLVGQFRPDLEGNMPDQVNVALCGYDVFLYTEEGKNIFPAGKYRIGMAAKNRVTGLKLVNWTNRFVEL